MTLLCVVSRRYLFLKLFLIKISFLFVFFDYFYYLCSAECVLRVAIGKNEYTVETIFISWFYPLFGLFGLVLFCASTWNEE